MKPYYVNKIALSNGSYEVHASSCMHLPEIENCIYLGIFENCSEAINEAEKFLSNVNGCKICLAECHKKQNTIMK
jgi:hypothetical protein